MSTTTDSLSSLRGMEVYLRHAGDEAFREFTEKGVIGKSAVLANIAKTGKSAYNGLRSLVSGSAAEGTAITAVEEGGYSVVPVVGTALGGAIALDEAIRGKTEAAKHTLGGSMGSLAGGFTAGLIAGSPTGPGAIITATAGSLIGYFGGSKAVDGMEYLSKTDPALVRDHIQWQQKFQEGLFSGDPGKAEQAMRDYIAHIDPGHVEGPLQLMPGNPGVAYAKQAYQSAQSRQFRPFSKEEMLSALPNAAAGYMAALKTGDTGIASEAYAEYTRFVFTLQSKGLEKAKAEEMITGATEMLRQQAPEAFSILAEKAKGLQPLYPVIHVTAAGMPPQTPSHAKPQQRTGP